MRTVAVVFALAVLVGCASQTPPPPARPGTTGAITWAGDDYLEFPGDDIFGDVALGGGSVWVATLGGLIQVDPTTLDATWHTDLAPGRKIVYAFESLWVGVAADADSIWTSQHGSMVMLRIDPAAGFHR